MYDRLKFVVWDKAEPNIQNIRGLKLAVVKLTTVQVTRMQKEELSITCYMCDTYT
jgi:hypothetical protein